MSKKVISSLLLLFWIFFYSTPVFAWCTLAYYDVLGAFIYGSSNIPAEVHRGEILSINHSVGAYCTVIRYDQCCENQCWCFFGSCFCFPNCYIVSNGFESPFAQSCSSASVSWYHLNSGASFSLPSSCTPLSYTGTCMCTQNIQVPSYLPEGDYTINATWSGTCRGIWEDTWGGLSIPSGRAAYGKDMFKLVNGAPSVSITKDPSGKVFVNQNVAFYATASDPDGDAIVQYRWTISGREQITTTSPVFTCSWNSAGTYTVSVEAQDSYGKWSNTASCTVEVTANNPPVAFVTSNGSISLGQSITANGTTSYDPDPGDRIVQASWRYKNPSGSWSNAYTQNISDPKDIIYSFIPDAPGIWVVELKVIDTYGAYSTATSSVQVLDIPTPTISPAESCFTTLQPMIQWTFESTQSAFELIVKSMSGSTIYSSGVISSRDRSFILPSGALPLPGNLLWSGNKLDFKVQVRCKTPEGYWSAWASPEQFCVIDSFNLSGEVIPNPGERERKIRVTVTAKSIFTEDPKQIANVHIVIPAPVKPNGSPSLYSGQMPHEADMVYNLQTKTYSYEYLIPSRSYIGYWPDDGDYQIKVVGTDGSTSNELYLPFRIKGNVKRRIIFETIEW